MKVVNIPINNIEISKYNVRKSIAEEELDNLANSIRENELLQPIIVIKRDGGKYELIAGQRRYFACKNKLQWTEIPARVLPDASDLKIVTLSTVENLQRVNLNQVEKMEAFTTIYKMFKGNINDVAKTTGYSEQTVKTYLDLQEGLDESVKKEIEEEKIIIGTKTLEALVRNKNISKTKQKEILTELVGIKNQKKQIEIIKTIEDERSRKSIIEGLRGRDLIIDFALQFFLYRIKSIQDDSLRNIFKNIMKNVHEITERVRSLNSMSPIFQIIFEFREFEHFFIKLEKALAKEPRYFKDFLREQVDSFKYHPEELLDLIYKDFKQNIEKFSNEFKYELINKLEKIYSEGIYKERIKEFISVLKS